MDWLRMSALSALTLVFLASTLSKASPARLRAFAGSLPEMGLPSSWPPMAVASGLMVLELVAIPSLWLSPVAGSMLAMLLLVLFSGSIWLVVRRRKKVFCRCFGASATPVGWIHLGRNGVLLALGAAVFVLSLSASAAEWRSITGSLEMAAPGLVLGLMLTRLDDLMFLMAPGPHPSAEER